MVAAASVVVVVGAVAGLLTALDDAGGGEAEAARPQASPSVRPDALPASPPSSPPPSPSRSASPSPTPRKSTPAPTPRRTATKEEPGTTAAATRLYRHPDSQVADWLRAHPGDPRRDVIANRIAGHPAAVWFTDHTPATLTSRVRAVTSAAAAQGRVPVLVPYAIPDRDCGGHSEGGAPDLDAYDAWIDRFAAGLGSGRPPGCTTTRVTPAGTPPPSRRAG